MLKSLEKKSNTEFFRTMMVQTSSKKKVYIKKVNGLTWNLIRSSPYIIRVEENDLRKNSIPIINRFEISES